MSWVMVDVEADGPCPGIYSMTEIGAVVVKDNRPVDKLPAFYGKLRPISDYYVQEALDVCKRTRQETLSFPYARETMQKFSKWLKEFGGNRPMFVSDNNGFDFQFVNYYFWAFCGNNPFGHSSMNMGSLYKGLIKNTFKNFKKLRKPFRHTHHPVDDCLGNVQAFIKMKTEFGLKIAME